MFYSHVLHKLQFADSDSTDTNSLEHGRSSSRIPFMRRKDDAKVFPFCTVITSCLS